MKKIIVFLGVAAIVMISLPSLTSIVLGEQVTRINKNKGLVYIDGGKNSGFVLEATVCIYSFTGEEITCGRIQKTTAAYSVVKVNNRTAKQIQNGMEAILSVETTDTEKPLEKKGCVDDSECGEGGFCINGKCR
jgi:Cys-rich repeat protein